MSKYLKSCKTEKTWFPLTQKFKHTGGIMGEKSGSRSKINSIPLYELCLKITTYSIYHHASPRHQVFLLRMRVECPNFKL